MVTRTIAQIGSLLARHADADQTKHERAPEGALGEARHRAGAGYLITCSVLVSKKWMRSGTKLSRIFSCGLVLTEGSKDRSDDSELASTRRSSGRTPSVTIWPL